MKIRILTSLIIILVVLPPILLGGWWLQALGLFVVITVVHEWFNALPGHKLWSWLSFLFMAVVILEAVLIGYRDVIFCAFILFLWSLPIFLEEFEVENSFALMAFFAIVSLAYASIQIMVSEHWYLLTICLANYGSDTGAFFTGKFFGKHKMNPRISPKKTWEGFFGGWIFGTMLGLLFSLFYIRLINPWLNTILCLICPLGAVLGDLCFSLDKRHWHLKDFSGFLPGHGGILDRLDSLLFNLVLFFVVYSLF